VRVCDHTLLLAKHVGLNRGYDTEMFDHTMANIYVYGHTDSISCSWPVLDSNKVVLLRYSTQVELNFYFPLLRK